MPAHIGSPLSVNSLSKLLQVAPRTVDNWLSMFERLYLCYRIPPFGGSRIRAVRKEKKLYFWDWSRVSEPGPRFENMVAGHLLKFVVLGDGSPEFAVECKTGERNASSACRYFRERTDIPRFYQVHLADKSFGNADSDVLVLPFVTFCADLGLP